MKLDSHQHFWQVARGDYAWMSPELTTLYRDFMPDDLEPEMRAAGVTETIVVQAAATLSESHFLCFRMGRSGDADVPFRPIHRIAYEPACGSTIAVGRKRGGLRALVVCSNA